MKWRSSSRRCGEPEQSFLAAIDNWLDQNFTESLISSPYFSILADECEDVATYEELSICCRWLVGGKPK